jgi:hypothetical protein
MSNAAPEISEVGGGGRSSAPLSTPTLTDNRTRTILLTHKLTPTSQRMVFHGGDKCVEVGDDDDGGGSAAPAARHR